MILVRSYTSHLFGLTALLILLITPGKEIQGAELDPLGWRSSINTPTVFECYRTTDSVYSGQYALKCRVAMFNFTPFTLSSSWFHVTEGDSIRFSFYYNTSAHIRIFPTLYYDNSEILGSGSVGKDTNDLTYQYHSVVGKVPEDATQAYVYFDFWIESGFHPDYPENQFIDEISVESLHGSAGNVLNGDFELDQVRAWNQRSYGEPPPRPAGITLGIPWPLQVTCTPPVRT